MGEHQPGFGRTDLFGIPDGITYLNAAGVSPIPRPVREAGAAGVERKAAPWELSRASFYDIVEEARVAASSLIGCRPGDIAIVGSASYGIATACRNLPLPAGTAVVTIAEEHPSPVYAWIRAAEAAGAVHHEIPRPADHDWTAAILERIASRDLPRVSVLSLTPLHWNDGAILDLAAIRRAADTVGASLVVDGTQAIGVQPFPLAEIRPDFLVFPTYKWLLGPYGLAFLYVDPERQAGIPLEEHTFSRLGADTITNHYGRELRFMDGARRYDMGERSNFVTLPMGIAGMRLLSSWGAERISAYLRPLAGRLIEGAARLGFSAPPAHRVAAHLVGLRRDGTDAGAIAGRLAERGIHVSARNGAIRVAPHVYNDEADIDRFLDGLAESA
ncbi:aminotransferase class V-fold PLP-dependent enzyme [Enterovirga rhinocerotis]|uniref:Selenocysteine lyase/cysteine desulfurase n=1 Tax=Enterovirga rhinocerotis TaxID=1339210 RepID=A0A4R7C3I5_9HYPH|nr:aminotransferase class V-fold PLP-dependent enzyme [Enterovirga rhinocerotis]TDR92968.1 selenocysteine lyase/cysteine desulfurase [Enterovirga rhinocerotis]